MTTLSDYTDMEKEIDEVPEPEVLPAGTEVQLRIIQVEDGTSDKRDDCAYYLPRFEVVDQPLVKEFTKFFWELDRSKHTPKQLASAMRAFKKFADCFGIDYSRPFSWVDDLPGMKGWVILGVEGSEDSQYGKKNFISQFISPK